MNYDPTEVPKSGTPAVLEALARAPDVIIPLVKSAHPDVLKRRPEAGRWSIHEHACHLAAVHPMISGRLDQMLRLDDPVIASYDPAQSGEPIELVEMDLEDSLRRFRSDRGALVDRLLGLDPSDWSRTARHEEYNAYSVLIMIRHLALHDFFHAYRIEELVLHRGWPNAPQLAS